MGSDEPACVRGLQWRRYLDKAADLGVRSSGLKLTPLRRARGEAHCANVNNSSATPPPQISASAAPIHAALHLLARLSTPPDRRAGAARTTPTSQPDRGVRRRHPAPPPPMLPIFMITPPASPPATPRCAFSERPMTPARRTPPNQTAECAAATQLPPQPMLPIFAIARRTSKPAHSTAPRLLSATYAARVHDSNASNACGGGTTVRVLHLPQLYPPSSSRRFPLAHLSRAPFLRNAT